MQVNAVALRESGTITRAKASSHCPELSTTLVKRLSPCEIDLRLTAPLEVCARASRISAKSVGTLAVQAYRALPVPELQWSIPAGPRRGRTGIYKSIARMLLLRWPPGRPRRSVRTQVLYGGQSTTAGQTIARQVAVLHYPGPADPDLFFVER